MSSSLKIFCLTLLIISLSPKYSSSQQQNLSKRILLPDTHFYPALSEPRQKLKFEHISIEEGLSQSTVWCIFQDSKGFMWFGTQEGLNKYDGYRFTIFKHDPENPYSISSNIVRTIFEDRRGMLWIGTLDEGINRFDPGTETFIRYKHDPQNANSLSNNQVMAICEDAGHPGILWIGTGSGLNRFDTRQEKWTRYFHNPENPCSLSDNSIWPLHIDAPDSAGVYALWVGTAGGLDKLMLHTDSSVSKEINSKEISRLVKEKFIHYRHDPENPNTLSFNSVWAIYPDPQQPDILWIGTYSGLNKFNRRTEQWKVYRRQRDNANSLLSNRVRSISRDQSGGLWVGTEEGLSLLGCPFPAEQKERDAEKWIHYKQDTQNPNSLSHNSTLAVFRDRSGVMWVGTFGGGINRVKMEKRFAHYKQIPGNPNSLNSNFVRSICESGNKQQSALWVGTQDRGLSLLCRDNNGNENWSHFRHEYGNPHSLQNNTVLSIMEDNRGVIWAGTAGGGISRLIAEDSQGKEWKYYGDQSPEQEFLQRLSASTINAIYESRHDKWEAIWIATSGEGLYGLIRDKSPTGVKLPNNKKNSRTGRKMIQYQNEPGNPRSLPHNNVSTVYQDKTGVLWIGTDEGLCRMNLSPEPEENNTEQGVFTIYQYSPDNLRSLSSNRVTAIHEDRSGTLWIGTGFGLNKIVLSDVKELDKEIFQFTRYTEKNGLPNNVIHGILEDAEGNLWLSTNDKLAKFDPEAERFRVYDVSDGLQSNEFNGGAYFQSRGGEMFFGGVNGVTSFYPERITDNPLPPPIVITDFKIFNESVPIAGTGSSLEAADSYPQLLLKHISETEEIVLSYQENVFSFEFAALDYTNPSKNRYAYKMEGFDDQWRHAGSQRFTTFTNLPAGKYIFRVKGSNSDDVWNEKGASIRILITPPLWKTWWAYTFYVLLFISIIYGIMHFQLSRVQLRQKLELEHIHAEKLQEIDRMKSRFFANISHEFRTPLTLILGPLQQLSSGKFKGNPRKQYGIMIRSGQRLLRLINQLLDLSKLEAGSMSLKAAPENICRLLRGIVLSFSSLAERKHISLKFESAEEDIRAYVDRDKFDKIISNLLSNAFKFTPEGGRVIVEVDIPHNPPSKGEIRLAHSSQVEVGGMLEIRIADTGVGIPADKLEHVFDRFYQVDASQTREQEGSGIGLALTKELVELHHGQILVSGSPGAGTTFTVRLPLGKAHLKAEEIVDIIHNPPSSEGTIPDLSLDENSEQILIAEKAPFEVRENTPIILIVEDNPDVRTYINDYLKNEYQIVEAANGMEGFEKSIAMVPDLIISDVMMPKMDGYELCRKLKSDERTSHIPVILLTARASGESKVEGLETGADDYIIKPFEARELQARIRNLIEQRRKLRERFQREIILRPKELVITSLDEQFLNRVMETIEKNISDPEFTTDAFASEVAMSRMNLNRKLQALTGYSTHEFIRNMRLKRAAQLLQHGAGTVTEICYDVGFASLSHFAQAFREQFGQSPSQFAARHSSEA